MYVGKYELWNMAEDVEVYAPLECMTVPTVQTISCVGDLQITIMFVSFSVCHRIESPQDTDWHRFCALQYTVAVKKHSLYNLQDEHIEYYSALKYSAYCLHVHFLNFTINCPKFPRYSTMEHQCLHYLDRQFC